jgi:hypothetical protein
MSGAKSLNSLILASPNPFDLALGGHASEELAYGGVGVAGEVRDLAWRERL